MLAGIKRMLRTKRETGHPLVKQAIRLIDHVRARISPYLRFVTDRRFRATTLLRWFKKEQLHQTEPFTCMDRYPQIFETCRRFFTGRPDIRILSFGCSSGEEVITIRRYFPDARIVGAEINPISLALCLKQPFDDRMSFVLSDPVTIARQGPFDLIFCMAVLQRTPGLVEKNGITNLRDFYPFEKFDLQLQELNALLNNDGLLVIHHSQYYLEDSSLAAMYEVIEATEPTAKLQRRFDRNSNLVEGVSGGSIFKKLG